MSEEKSKHGPHAAGKGSIYRPVDHKAWDEWWRNLCKVNGHRYRNGICIRCGRLQRMEVDNGGT